MPDKREVFDTPDIRQTHLLPVLAALSTSFADAARMDLHVRLQGTASFKLLLPHWDQQPKRPASEVKAFRTRIAVAVNDGAMVAYTPDTRVPRSEDLELCANLLAASVLAIVGISEPRTAFDLSEPLLAVMQGDDLAQSVADTVRRSRHAAIALGLGAQQPSQIAVVRLSNNADDGATLDGLRAGQGGEPVLLGRVETPGGVVWLDQHRTIPRERRGDLGQVLAGLVAAGLLPPEASLLIFADTQGRITACILPGTEEFTPASESLVAQAPPTPIQLTLLRLDPSEQALAALVSRVTDRDFPIGYRIELRPLPSRLRSDPDVEHLRERISELQAEIALIQAMAAPQLRLLRFTDEQLPALVDGLRRMPAQMQRDSRIMFATGHAGGRPGPAHFVLYDPALVSFDGRLPEFYWRSETVDTPMSYWLDPHAATAMTGAVGEPVIFVPDQQRIIPAIDSFGGTLNQTLRIALGRLFTETASLMNGADEQPIFVFSPPTEPGFELDVELLGRKSFAPLILSLRWINSHMLVRSPRIADPLELARLADDLYEGQIANTLRDGVAADIGHLNAEWQAAAAALSQRIAALTETLTAEVDQTRQRVTAAHGYLATARARIGEIDASVGITRDLLANAERRDTEVRKLPTGEQCRRYAFVADLLAEIEAGEVTLAESVERIAQQRQRIADLVRRLEE